MPLSPPPTFHWLWAMLHPLLFDDRCRHCGHPRALLCQYCLALLDGLERSPAPVPDAPRTLSLYNYEEPLRSWLQRAKFGGESALLSPLASTSTCKGSLRETLLQTLAHEVDLITPIPDSPARRAARGFNPAALLALHWAPVLGLPVEPLLKLKRTRSPQVGRSREARWEGLRDRFIADDKAHSRRVLIVDDVVSTGATLHAARHALLRAGAEEVWALTLAATPQGA